jgi:hypothetical protein
MSRTRWYGRMVRGLVLVGGLWLGLQPAAAQRASLSSIDAKLDQFLPVIHNDIDLVLQKLDSCIDLAFTRPPVTFPGDGQGHGPPLRDQDNGDGTITDLNTRLMWEKKSPDTTPGSCLGTPNPFILAEQGVNRECTLEEARDSYIPALNNVAFAGHTDWRLPNVKELMSIVDYGRFNQFGGLINPTFGPLLEGYHWSSTFSGVSSLCDSCWFTVNFSGGDVGSHEKATTLPVRAVRGGQ